ncbi:hypothetical protein [Hathewaya massiliensis]|nr:hypothetical protein [Hathewaya massiliensis]
MSMDKSKARKSNKDKNTDVLEGTTVGKSRHDTKKNIKTKE